MQGLQMLANDSACVSILVHMVLGFSWLSALRLQGLKVGPLPQASSSSKESQNHHISKTSMIQRLPMGANDSGWKSRI